ncbi:tetratricopeptide repeat protein [Nocardioides bigeumensis]|uniref:Tetratricopeptide repeat protein n=1 Tax=Nocardioides bigeumensis TaxID=433657 RepID=A0ABP5JZ15_9ACTN
MNPDLDRAEILLDLHRPADAERLARDCLAGQPDSAEALNLLGRALNDQGRHREAEGAIRAALALEPDEGDHVLQLASTLSQLGQQVAAVTLAQRLLTLRPHEWSSHYIHAQALLSGRRPRRRSAYDAAQRARDLAPWNPETHNLLGVCAADLGRQDEAEACYHEALRLDPEYVFAMNNLAALDLDRGRFGRAGAGLTAAAQRAPQDDVVRLNLDIVVVTWAQRLSLADLALGVLAAALLAIGAPWVVRAAVGTAYLAGLLGLLATFRRQLPRGLSLGPRLLGRLPWSARRVVVLASLCTLALVILFFAPVGVAAATGVATLTLLQLVGALVLAGWLLSLPYLLARQGRASWQWHRTHGRWAARRRRGKTVRFR